MALSVPGYPQVRIEELGPSTRETAIEILDFYADVLGQTYNGHLMTVGMNVPLVADPGDPAHIALELEKLRGPATPHTQFVARNAKLDGQPIVGQVWLANGSNDHPNSIVIEEWNTAVGYREKGVGAAVLAAAMRVQPPGRQLALKVLRENPVRKLLEGRWGLQVAGDRVYPDFISSGMPHVILEGSDEALRGWLDGKARLVETAG